MAADARGTWRLFNLALDSKLRRCDLVIVKVEDVAPHGYAIDRATVRQNKTGRPVRSEITEQMRQTIDEHLGASRKRPGDFMFHGRRDKGRCLSTCRNGSPASVSTRRCSARIRWDKPRPP
jgi:integrase